MEASVVATSPPEEVQASHDGAAEATRSTEELFKWSGYVHVGAGAEGCEHSIDGACQDPAHFHAWVCLPNAFQVRDISDKARAAKARKMRALRDPESDAHAVLEAELDDLRLDHYEELVDALARSAIDRRIGDVIEEINADERFEHHAQDAEEFQRLSGLSEEERDAEEYERLQADMLAYGEAFQAKVDEIHKAEVAHLGTKTEEEVIELERKSRIENIATEMYLHTYYTWAMYVGAREPTTDGFPAARKFKAPEDLRNAAPEVVVALRAKVKHLEERTASRGDAAGN